LPKGTQYAVVINHEEQYSIWPADKRVAKGWKTTKVKGDLKYCHDYIEEVWTDMRPLRVRKR
jgi:MbtH protein